ncbi:hypothetical protein A3F03_02435 [Candidatus Roizmanbacteria bacterium RIFCSPHIGHO2_12_FULL_41_11]|uniref:Polymerase nucleotidyl transferase domain-containing protein n=1 Tax=Candidatus Roizmanbacteria bacterium RIFCSPHIGHO2_12_FULL_41_11 TaxID=1802052 RepID=A0A1F7I3X9_9BACT|nr:MAG: hypothetical protein A3F03_02435 [Candidatus Roizmanbacteria bacterium RIFCSPHIGHO2_12_FULL_41_11]
MTPEQAVRRVLKYFNIFQYPPSFPEIYTFFPQKIARANLRQLLARMVVNGSLVKAMLDGQNHYCLPENKRNLAIWSKRHLESQQKITLLKQYLRFLSHIPQLKLVAYSGSIAMANTTPKDDVDLFIVTGKERLWTARFIAIVAAQLFGLRSFRHPSRVCLNMFFDKQNLAIPALKRNLYVGHEALQLRPIINKNFTYQYFLAKNTWLNKLFPNVNFMKLFKRRAGINLAEKPFWQAKVLKLMPIGDILEYLLKKIQLTIIQKRLTQEVITDTQLWLIQNDFEKEVARKIDI